MLDTLGLYEELSTALDPQAARVLASAMGRLYREIAATVTKEELAGLKAIVAELAEAQKRTEEEVRQLAKGLRETRQMVGGLSDTVGCVLEDRAIPIS